MEESNDWIEQAIKQHRQDTEDLPSRVLNIYTSESTRHKGHTKGYYSARHDVDGGPCECGAWH